MISIEGIIWCWKMNSNNTLFIFREEGQEVEITFNDSYELLLFNSEYQLTDVEKRFLISLNEQKTPHNKKFKKMDREKLTKEFMQLVADNYDIERDSIEEEDKLADDIGMDSLDRFDLFGQLERKYSISIPDEDIEEQTTIGDVINYLLTRL